MCVIDQGDEGWVVVSQALTLLWSTRIFWQLLCQYSSVGSSKQLKFLAKRLNLIKTVGSVTHPYDSGSQLVQLYSITKRNSDRPSLLRPTEFMRAYHPAGLVPVQQLTDIFALALGAPGGMVGQTQRRCSMALGDFVLKSLVVPLLLL